MSAPLSPPSGGDRGDAEPRVRAALAACLADDPDTYRNAYLEAVSTLCAGVRLFMPVMADEAGEIGAVKLTNEQGSTALLAFTGIDSLTAWDSRARPVPGLLPDLAATVTEVQAGALLIDAAGPAPLVLGPDVLGPIEHGGKLVKFADGWGWVRREDLS
ncbi:SseB family protein [Cutibacterium avidum]|uniref:Exosortase n=1 Tax=Cutibacterium avidum TaxID=33010 RepID=A0A3E2DM16_9ACTN|nr:SseB family protein [Cutibacterium avidum]RFT46348.1 exosortase [Cutibacterium avidum]TMT54577.1 exosortase [Cutibacterium avidum]